MERSNHILKVRLWLDGVDQILRRKYFIDSESAGWDVSDIKRFYETDFSPCEFVEWYAEKYDLQDMSGISFSLFSQPPHII